ncbi:MAG: FtsW/RodA/SpoVE family cell cycle protein, partial [Clostridium sp.]|nr:FtsW/RodA/SpoVE family cell cycle protein [Clostridium sp.]
MANVVTQLARYLMILLIAVYTYYNFRYFSYEDREDRRELCRNQVVLMFLILVLADTVTWLRTEDVMLMGLCGVQALFLMAFLLLSRGLYRRMSPLLLNNTC